MTDPTEPLRAYVRTALELQGYEFDEERIAAITLQFERIEEIARTILPPAVDARSPAAESDPAPVFRP